MLVVVCPGCGHLNNSFKKIPRDTRFRCLLCDSRQGRVHRHYKVWLVNLHDRAPPRERAIADTWGGLLTIAETKNYKVGWAMHKFKLIYAFWPNELLRKLADPYAELQDWVEKEKNKFKAEKKREEKERWEAIKSGQYRDVVAIDSRPFATKLYTSEFMDKGDWDVAI